jgi:hypothetical protein
VPIRPAAVCEFWNFFNVYKRNILTRETQVYGFGTARTEKTPCEGMSFLENNYTGGKST